jgi:acyl-CoA reductase-like NAD-dependent aldehyde dehydrogenase
VQRVFAHASIARDVAQRLADIGSQYQVGDPLDAKTEIGPLIRHAETDRIESWVKQAEDEGAEIICGGKRISDAVYQATGLLNPSADSLVSRREIFGPVVCVYTYDDVDDAIAQANNLPYSFQASVCTKNIDTAMYISSRINASAVMINDHTAFRVDWMPFAGLKESGYGIGGIPHTYKDMQIEKLTVIRSSGL